MDSMRSLVENFGNQLLDAVALTKNLNIAIKPTQINHIVISGLGGSGIGGSFAVDYLQTQKCKVPVLVNKDYNLPSFVNANTLFIACSYSGNTEETLEAVNKAAKAGATIACITSGGKLMALAAKKDYPVIGLPTGFPPRSAFAYSSTALFKMLQAYGIINKGYEKEIFEAVGIITTEEKNLRKEAKAIAKKLMDKQIVMYCGSNNEAVLVRFRQQLNENGKVLACHHVVPEMNHNELVGWKDKGNYAVINMLNGLEHKRTLARFEIIKPTISKLAKSVTTMQAQGKGFITRGLYLVHLGDLVSVELAELRKMDATEVKIIDYLKKSLEAIK
jgi:glucose/mannose-6-phosphate isomerase